MKSKRLRLLIGAGFFLLWIVIWEICATTIDLSFAIAHPLPTFLELVRLLVTAEFWIAVSFSALRILLGFILGILFSVLLFLLVHRIRWMQIGIRQIMTILKSTPVASFILVLWYLIGRDGVPIAIALVMVLPIVYEGLHGAWNSLDSSLCEMLTVFRVRGVRRLRIFIVPEMLRLVAPALISAAGLSWKAGIAAEIIAYTGKSIGKALSDARNFFEGPTLFAWTIAVILLSYALERLLASLKGRYAYDDKANEDV